MSSIARSKRISEFRAGSLQVLVSSDAGAEGQNLQFCNCVLNYDLPWNPMKIEQRIGRVHRITQHRDVHVANLFALGTVDERVYRLLHDKLRMFELLFGQVTTVLGELDEQVDMTFEQRILDAVVADSDEVMDRKLTRLGHDLEEATIRAHEQIGAANGISAWLTTEATAHRASIPKGGSRELAPAIEIRQRQRQRLTTTWAMSWLRAVGATVDFEERSDDGELTFASVSLPEHVQALFFGWDSLHLAFLRAGLAMHPDFPALPDTR